MKSLKSLSKRGLALFLVFTMCISLLPVDAMAAALTTEKVHTHNQDGWVCEEKVTYACGKEEHTHTDACYEETEGKELVCKLDEIEEHQHGEDCYDDAGELICELTETHVHEDACYAEGDIKKSEPVCGLEEIKPHKHGEECYEPATERKLACGKEEHTHTEECEEIEWTCTEPEKSGLLDKLGNALSGLLGGGSNVLSVKPGETDVAKYTFLDANDNAIGLKLDNGTTVTTQILQEGDTLQVPAAPVKQRESEDDPYYVFDGWYQVKTDRKVDVKSGPIGTVTEGGEEYTLEPRYKEFWHVNYMNGDGTSICYIAEVPVSADVAKPNKLPDGAEDKAKAAYVPKTAGNAVQSWTYSSDVTNGVTCNVTATATEAEGVWVSFDTTADGPKVAPVQPDKDTKLVPKPADPVWLGYTFQGWYTDASCTVEFDFATTEVITATTLYAKWEAQEVSYTVIYWAENANWENPYLDASKQDPVQYSNIDTVRGTAMAGSDVAKLVDLNAKKPSPNEGFKDGKVDGSTIISGDGATIVNVYYDREEFTVTWRNAEAVLTCTREEHSHTHEECCTKTGWHLICNHDKCGKDAHSHTNSCYKKQDKVITAKYGADISSQWPGGNWEVDKSASGEQAYQANMMEMPLGGQGFSNPDTGTSKSAEYYVKDLNGNDVLHHTDRLSNGSTVSAEDRYAIPGFTLNTSRSTSIGSSYNGAKFYYDRNTYHVTYMVDGETYRVVDIPYEGDIAVYIAKADIVNPTADGKSFEKWCLDKAGEQDASSTLTGSMPARNIIVYAKWQETQYTVTVEGGASFKVKAGDVLDATTIAQKAGLEASDILGYKVGGNVIRMPYTPTGDVTLVPIRVGQIKVNYDDERVKDEKNYAQNAMATVLPGQDREGEQFDYWYVEGKEDTPIYPGAVINVGMGVTLYGHYTKLSEIKTVQITYNANFEGAEPASKQSDVKQVNDTIDLLGNQWTREGYEFLGWAKTSDATTAEFTSGKVLVDAVESNVLYAVWKVKSYDVTYEYTGDVHPANEPAAPVVDGKVAYNTPVTVAGAPSVPGYTFSGWATTDATVNEGSFTMPAKAVKLTGSWTLDEYNITYNYALEGVTVSSNPEKYTVLDSAIKLTNPSKAGYTFTGWSGTGLEGDANMDVTIPAGSVGNRAYTAHWSQNEYTVTYAPGDHGAFGAVPHEKLHYGDPTPAAPAATGEAGYTFDGWDPEIAPTVTGTVTYTAKWKANTDTQYKVEHYQQNVTDDGYTLKETEGLTGTTGAKATAQAKTYEGFTCDRKVDGTLTEANIAGDGSTTLRLYYTRNSYQVTYSYTGSKPDAAQDAPGSASYKFGAPVTVANKPTLNGYTFNGWTTTDATVNEGSFTMPAKAVRLTGSWTANESKITFMPNGGTFAAEFDGEMKGKTDDELGGTMPVISRKGYTFDGWYAASNLSGEVVTALPEKYPAGGMTYYAGWTPESYTITYDLKKGTLGDGKTNPEGYTVETPTFTLNNPTKEGYVFLGWTGSNGTAPQTQVSIVKGSTGDKNYTANWGKLTATGNTWTYDGQKHRGTVTKELPDGYIVQYRTSSDNGTTWTDWSTTAPSIINAGTIKVEACVYNDNAKLEVEGLTASYTLTVTPKHVTPAVTVEDRAYNGSAEVTVNITGVNGKAKDTDKVSIQEVTTIGTMVDAAAGDKKTVNVPVEGLTLVGDGAGNYVLDATTTTVNITKAEAPGDIIVPGEKDAEGNLIGADNTWLYDGQAHSAYATLNAAAEAAGYGEIKYSMTPSITNAGKITVTATAESDNYATLTEEFELIVTQRPVRVTVSPVDRAYDEQDYTVDLDGTSWTVTAKDETSGLVGTDGVTLITEGLPTQGTIETNTVGDQKVTVEGSADSLLTDSKNYDVTLTVGDVTISKAEAPGEIIVPELKDAEGNLIGYGYTWVYDGEEHTGSASLDQAAKDAGYGEISYSVEPSIMDAGSITVTATATSDNYVDLTKTFTLTVTPKGLTVSLTATDRDYIAGDRSVAVSLDELQGLVEKDEGTVTLANRPETGTAASDQVGTWSVTIDELTLQSNGNEKDNYTLKQPSTTVNITSPYVIRYIDEDTGSAVRSADMVRGQKLGTVIDVNGITRPAIPGYTYTSASVDTLTIGVDVAENVITLYYSRDVIGGQTPGEGDGIPDKYQITVTYEVENGYASFYSRVLNKYDANGRLSASGTAVVGASDVPGTWPDDSSYTDDGWTVRDVVGYRLTRDWTFYYTYTVPDPEEEIEIEEEDIPESDIPLAGANGLNDVDHFSYIIGYEDDTVRPLNNITRAEVATIYLRLMTEVSRIINWSTENEYSDVNVGDWHNNAISTTTQAGIVFGYSDGTYKPNQNITRGEFAAFAANTLSGEYTGEEIADFADTVGHPYATAIRRCVEAGWLDAEEDLFRPDEYITRAEAITIFNRMLHRLPDADHMLPGMKVWVDNPASAWYYEAVQEATNEHEYVRDEQTQETWIVLLPATDWKALEKKWAEEYGASAAAPEISEDLETSAE